MPPCPKAVTTIKPTQSNAVIHSILSAWISDSEVSDLARINKIRPLISSKLGKKSILAAPQHRVVKHRVSANPQAQQSSTRHHHPALIVAGVGQPTAKLYRNTPLPMAVIRASILRVNVGNLCMLQPKGESCMLGISYGVMET